MTLQQLTYFLAATDHGSFSAAADTLSMAQPSLSEQIRRLEAGLKTATDHLRNCTFGDDEKQQVAHGNAKKMYRSE